MNLCVLILYYDDIKNVSVLLDNFLKIEGLRTFVLCNGGTLNRKDKEVILSRNAELIIADSPQKPQHFIQNVLKRLVSEYVLFLTDRDRVTPQFKSLLEKSIECVKNTAVARLAHNILSESANFSNRPILSGNVFNVNSLLKGHIMFDYMFRERNGILVETIGDSSMVAFEHVDVPFFQGVPETAVSLIVTVKNRLDHWRYSMPTLVSQMGVPYELVLVDYYSEDCFERELNQYIIDECKKFSTFLDAIRVIRLTENAKFSSCKAKNLGARETSLRSQLLVFSDIDTLLREDYIAYWISAVQKNKTACFASNRAGWDRRIATEVNYGNTVISKKLYWHVQGHNENIKGYGGDDDEFYNRLENAGAVECNPVSASEARQYSILHGDEERMKYLEEPSLSGLQNYEFRNIKSKRWAKNNSWGKQPHIKIFYDFQSSKLVK
jgi:hypothetical protein